MITTEQARAAAAYIQSGGEPDDHERPAKIAWDRLAEWAIQELSRRSTSDEPAVSAADRMERRQSGMTVDVDPAEDIATLTRWAMERLARRTPPDDGPMTAEESDRAYDEAEAVPISDEEIESLLQRVRDRSDKDKITAEWLESIGFVDDDGLYAAVALRLSGQVATVKLLYHRTTSRVRLGGFFVGVYSTRSQLLALLAALRGEPSQNPGRLQPLSPAEQLPHASRGQLNNLGGGR